MSRREIFSKDELTQEELKDAKASYDFKARMTHKRKDRTGLQLEMRLTFDEWLDIWLASGKLLMRGRAKGDYCMSRKDDLGHYEKGNVVIQLTHENARDAKLGRPGLKGRVSPTKGMTQSEATKEKHRQAKLAQAKKQCPHCSRTFDAAAYGRYHGGRCEAKSDQSDAKIGFLKVNNKDKDGISEYFPGR